MPSPAGNERGSFESVIQALESDLANIGAHLSIDAHARQIYARRIREMADELRLEVNLGRLSWAQAAEQAQLTRNAVMETIRARSTPVGLAIAQRLKSEGVSLNQLVAKKSVQIFGPGTVFGRLSAGDKDRVYAEIVRSAAKSNPQISATMRRLSRAGRGLLLVSVALSVYEIAVADDKLGVARRELVVTGVSVGAGIASGALAGLACGPGAPVCVTVGAFVGGTLAALGMDLYW